MSKFDVSICLITKRRNPGVDKAIQLLEKQSARVKSPIKFEYIIADGLYGERSEEIRKLIGELNPSFPVKYIPDKPSRWDNTGLPALCNARNTCAIYSEAANLLFFDDCAVGLSPDFLDRSYYWLSKGNVLAGTWFTHPGKTYGYEYRVNASGRSVMTDLPGNWLYGACMGFPMNAYLDIGGSDESHDGEIGLDDVSLGIRLKRAGYKLVFDPSIYVEYDLEFHHLVQSEPEKQGEGGEKKGWRIEVGVERREPKKCPLNGEEHFANEWLIYILDEDAYRVDPYGNSHVNLKEMRLIAQGFHYDVGKVQEALKRYVDVDPLDWRDGEPIKKRDIEGSV